MGKVRTDIVFPGEKLYNTRRISQIRNGGTAMVTALSETSLSIIKRMQQSELTESVIYEQIAKFAKGEENQRRKRPTTKSGKNIQESK